MNRPMIDIQIYSQSHGLHVVQFASLDCVLAEADEIAVAMDGVEAKVPVSEFIRLWHRHRPYLPGDDHQPKASKAN